ncbi:transmembrane protein 26 [Diachasmimorpha longicaudata]|uniref:transmembrane protein 26 n=1 Tax=Diachasmimorpha longicaudata TaxID=58733 RepID=UPI0030B90454
MARFIATIKAIITRLVFASHGFIAIWQVTTFKKNPLYWYLSCPILLLFFEGLFTLTIKENQEWKWFCPSVFLYLGSVVPAIWLLELDKLDRIMRPSPAHMNISKTLDLSHLAAKDLEQLEQLFGVKMQLPDIQISTETWVTLIEQFLMLVLIVGRWMLPKGDLTRDQLSQLLLVYIGTAADIIEFFDSFKEPSISSEMMLVYLTLGIWSWSLIQFTVVLTATKSRKSRLSTGSVKMKMQAETSCCSIDVWAIALNMILQDAPFLAFRLLIIIHFKIVSYMNIFFTCKNTLVILLQLYRLYVVQTERKTRNRKRRRRIDKEQLPSISIVSRGDMYGCDKCSSGRRRRRDVDVPSETDYSSEEENRYELAPRNLEKSKRRTRNDTGYSTSSSRNSSKHEKYHKREMKRSSSTRREEFRKNEVTYEDEKRPSRADKHISRGSHKNSNPSKSALKSKTERKKRKEREKSESIEEDHSSNHSLEEGETESDSTGTESESEQRYQRRKRRSRE